MQIEWPNEDFPGGAEKGEQGRDDQGHPVADAPPGEGEEERHAEHHGEDLEHPKREVVRAEDREHTLVDELPRNLEMPIVGVEQVLERERIAVDRIRAIGDPGEVVKVVTREAETVSGEESHGGGDHQNRGEDGQRGRGQPS